MLFFCILYVVHRSSIYPSLFPLLNHVRTPLLFVQRSLGRGSREQGRIVDGPCRSLADPMQPLIDCWRGGREGQRDSVQMDDLLMKPVSSEMGNWFFVG